MRQESDTSGSSESMPQATAELKRWVYSGVVLTLTIAGFMWQWWRAEISYVETRMLGVETRLHSEIAASEDRQRSDLKDVRDRIDRMNDSLKDALKDVYRTAPVPDDRPRR